MNTGIKELVKGQIQFCLSQIKSPDEQMDILRELMPGAVEYKESFELQKVRIEAQLDKKERYRITPKNDKKMSRPAVTERLRSNRVTSKNYNMANLKKYLVIKLNHLNF